MKAISSITLLIGISAICLAAGGITKPIPAMANETNLVLREPLAPGLVVDKDFVHEERYDRKIPFGTNNDVYLSCGESLGLKLNVINGEVAAVTCLKEKAGADVELEFKQEAGKDGAPTMKLALKSNIKQVLYADAFMMIPGRKGLYRTSILPIQPGQMALETWPHPIVKLVLRYFRFKETLANDVLAEATASLSANLGPSTDTGITTTPSYGGKEVFAIGTGSSGKTDTSVRNQKEGYAFRFYYCDGRPEMNPPASIIKAYTSSGAWVCLFYEGGGYEPGTPKSKRSGEQCRTRPITGGYEGGQHDAAIAYYQAAGIGMPLGRPVFIALDSDPGPLGSARMKKIIEYYKGAADWAHSHGYTLGCYGGPRLLKALFDKKILDFGEETTAWCYGFHEIRSQIRQEGPGPYAAYAQDYGQWRWHETPTSATITATITAIRAAGDPKAKE